MVYIIKSSVMITCEFYLIKVNKFSIRQYKLYFKYLTYFKNLFVLDNGHFSFYFFVVPIFL